MEPTRDSTVEIVRHRRFTLEDSLFWIFSGLVLLLPLIFFPPAEVALLTIKYSLLVVAVVAAVAVWILLRLKDGVCLLPINMLNLAGSFVVLVLLVSTLLSGSIMNSLIGQLPSTDTFIFYLYVFLIMFMAPSVFNTPKRIFDLYRIFFTTLGVLALFHLTRLAFGSGWLNFGIFHNLTDNVLGKWNDLGIFFGLGAVLSLISLELLNLSKVWKVIVYCFLIGSMALLIVINFPAVWYVLAALALVFFIYSIVIARAGSTKKTTTVSLPVTSFVVFLISVVFIIGGARIGNVISSQLNVSQVEVIPTWKTTAIISKSVVFDGSPTHFLFGEGPNRFKNAWLSYKPAGVNSSVFWNTEFNSGVGLVPSSLVTTGVLGFIAWIAFLSILVYMGFRSVLSRIADPFQRYLVTSSFLAALYLWLFNVVYVPSLVIIVLTFLFTGIFIAALQTSGILKPTPFEYFKNPKVGFVSVLTLIIVLICGLGLVYVTASKVVASANFNRALGSVNKGDLDKGEKYIQNAISFDNNDLYARSLAQLYLIRLNNLLSSSDTSSSADVVRTQFTSISTLAVNAATYATQQDRTNYQNWMTLGNVWTSLVPLKVEKAYDNAKAAYQKAFSYNPKNPYIYLELAKLESAQNDAAKAKDELSKALKLKGDYTDAYLFLAQLQMAEGDKKAAIDSVTSAAVSQPNNEGLFFQLGVLRYNNQDYKDAIGALEKAVALNSQYSNAKYFLGLSYYQAGRIDDATKQFTDLKKMNPDNQEVANILSNLQSGKSPFKAEASAPAKTASSTDSTAR